MANWRPLPLLFRSLALPPPLCQWESGARAATRLKFRQFFIVTCSVTLLAMRMCERSPPNNLPVNFFVTRCYRVTITRTGLPSVGNFSLFNILYSTYKYIANDFLLHFRRTPNSRSLHSFIILAQFSLRSKYTFQRLFFCNLLLSVDFSSFVSVFLCSDMPSRHRHAV